ncbi:MAG: Fur family transcriptional regulator [Polymorphobacter sp.]|uniref:Fur family transcriptional regulator n=1 Tax=Polymorphobacter sp. TaxID=1909290 RepID=UPI003A836ED1
MALGVSEVGDLPGGAHPHRHRNRSGAALGEAARAAMEEAGEQWTPMRAAVFQALAGFERPASAYDVTDAVSTAQKRRVAANSVYRILDLFVARNVAMRVESANAYIVNAHPDCVHDCVFLVCDGCGRAVHIDDDSLGLRLRAQAEERGFVPAKSVIEMRGRCRTCAVEGGHAA